MHPVVEAALKDWRILNSNSAWWARFDSMLTSNGEVIAFLEYGVIHSNGQKETSLRTARYFQRQDGTIGIS